MSLISATQTTVRAQAVLRELCEQIEQAKVSGASRLELSRLCEHLQEQLESLLTSLEHTLVDKGESLAITRFPFDASDVERRETGRISETGTAYRAEPGEQRTLLLPVPRKKDRNA